MLISKRKREPDVGVKAALSGVLGVVGLAEVGRGENNMDTSSMGGSEKKEYR